MSTPSDADLRARRACTTVRVALLRGAVPAAVLLPLGLLTPGRAISHVVLAGTLCVALVAAALVERAAARRDAPDVGALAIAALTALSVPIAVAQGAYADGVASSGLGEGLTRLAALVSERDRDGLVLLLVASLLLWGFPCGLAAHHRIRAAEGRDPTIMLLVPLTLFTPLPGLLLVELVHWIAAKIDEWLPRRQVTE